MLMLIKPDAHENISSSVRTTFRDLGRAEADAKKVCRACPVTEDAAANGGASTAPASCKCAGTDAGKVAGSAGKSASGCACTGGASATGSGTVPWSGSAAAAVARPTSSGFSACGACAGVAHASLGICGGATASGNACTGGDATWTEGVRVAVPG